MLHYALSVTQRQGTHAYLAPPGGRLRFLDVTNQLMSYRPAADLPAPVLSVIVAAYNIERYINPCLDSILATTADAFEVIVVDDGSTDPTAALVDRYSQDRRVRVIHQANGGLGAARNAGLDEARGRFIMFVDGDDWIESDTLPVCLAHIEREPQADLFVFDYVDVTEHGHYRQSCPADFWQCRNAAWNKVYARELIGADRFDTDILYEDLARVRPWVARARHVAHIDRAFYNYRNRRSGSIMSSADTQRYYELFTAASRCIARIEDNLAPAEIARKLGSDWQTRFYTADVFMPGLVDWPRKIGSARKRREYAAEFVARLPDEYGPDKCLLAREFSIKIAIAAACYQHGAFRSGDLLLHQIGRIKRRITHRLGLGETNEQPR